MRDVAGVSSNAQEWIPIHIVKSDILVDFTRFLMGNHSVVTMKFICVPTTHNDEVGQSNVSELGVCVFRLRLSLQFTFCCVTNVVPDLIAVCLMYFGVESKEKRLKQNEL